MSQTMIYLLLIGALLLPALGAAVLRLTAHRLSERVGTALALITFSTAAACVLVLGREPRHELNIGALTLIQPLSLDIPAPQPPPADPNVQPTAEPTPAPSPTLRATPRPRPSATPTARITATPRATATQQATQTPTSEPTATTEPTATPEPPAEPPVVDETIIHVVEPGDTLRGIAELYGVDIAAIINANGLSEAEAENLQPGQELIIP